MHPPPIDLRIGYLMLGYLRLGARRDSFTLMKLTEAFQSDSLAKNMQSRDVTTQLAFNGLTSESARTGGR